MQPKTFYADEHEINPAQIDQDAVWVVKKLINAGYKAYLVGGSVRDLLVKRKPKDYDISTSASPEEIKALFKRRCLLIGKRFRLAHLRFGHKTIEVSTFRTGDNEDALIIRDNNWGTEEEDVIRRDFTINGLFYDPTSHTVIDYVGGWQDIHQGLLRTIGDPMIRFKQDPVRMIRLIKFRARFGFEIEETTKSALLKSKDEIANSSAARILEELMRMLESGASAHFFYLMVKSGLLEIILPQIAKFLDSDLGHKSYDLLLAADHIHQKNDHKLLSRSTLIACLLYPILDNQITALMKEQDFKPTIGSIITLVHETINKNLNSAFTHFPKRISAITSTVLIHQYRITPLSGRAHKKQKTLASKDFISSLNFFKIRALTNKELIDTYDEWNRAFISSHKKKSHHR